MDWIQFLAGLATILGGMYTTMKFLTKNIQKDVERHEKNFERLERESERREKEALLMNMRLDGLYKILLDKVYGNTK